MGEANSAVEPVKKPDGTPYTAAVLIPTINNADELDIVLERLTKIRFFLIYFLIALQPLLLLDLALSRYELHPINL